MSRPTQQILALNAFEPGSAKGLPDDVRALVERRKASFGPASVLFYKEPLHVVEASGTFLYAADGKRYLDLYNNVPSVGHCHPKVVEAIAHQAARLNCHTRYLFDGLHEYAERLLSHFPASLSNVAFTCTGSESNDLALRMARVSTGNPGVIVTETAYHGNTTAVTEISPSSYKKGAPPAYVETIPAPDPAHYGADVSTGFAQAVKKAMTALESRGHRLGAFVADSIFSSDGVYADPPGFLKAAIDLVQKNGALFIADEVQPGFARTGTAMWGFARHGVVPDMVTMGKPMGNGFPMGGVVTRPDLLSRFCDEFGYFNTFGGNPVASAAGLAVLDVIAEEGLMENALAVGAHLMSRLKDLGTLCPQLGKVRGSGLYIGLDIVDRNDPTNPSPATATDLINGLRERQILIGAAGPFGHVLKVRPPLCLTINDADHFVDTLGRVLGDRPAS
ncbi:MAG: aspartate aminotransferase family protein [Parvibaculum sp.]